MPRPSVGHTAMVRSVRASVCLLHELAAWYAVVQLPSVRHHASPSGTLFGEFIFSILYLFRRVGAPQGQFRAIFSGFRPPSLPAFAWRATGDISAEVFSMNKPSAWRSLVETATSIQGQATRWWWCQLVKLRLSQMSNNNYRNKKPRTPQALPYTRSPCCLSVVSSAKR